MISCGIIHDFVENNAMAKQLARSHERDALCPGYANTVVLSTKFYRSSCHRAPSFSLAQPDRLEDPQVRQLSLHQLNYPGAVGPINK